MIRAALLALVISCAHTSPEPHYAPIFSPVDGRWHTLKRCDFIPLVRWDGVITGCIWSDDRYHRMIDDDEGKR